MSGPAFTVRPVTRADADRWIDLRHALWPHHAREELAREAHAYFDGRGFMLEHVLVAVDADDTILGFAELSLRPYAEGCTTTPVAFLEGWFVVPEARGGGAGRALVTAAEEWAHRRGCREFASDTLLDNTASAAAHVALGFEEVEQIRCFRKALTSGDSGPADAVPAAGKPVSRTAWRVALRRAAHQVLDRPPVLDDPIAIPILGQDVADTLHRDPSAFERGLLDAYLRAFMAARSRFAEDHLDGARDHGVGQYVILGAGLDTFAYRQRRVDPPLRVWEIDHPATQAWKRRLLDVSGIAIPGSVEYVPVDFERDALPDALARAGFDANAGAVFAWLGVTMYLTSAAIDATLGFIAAASASGGGVAFDYAVDRALLTPREQIVFDRLADRVAAAREPWRTTFDPAVLAARLRALGFGAIEDAGADELNARYFTGRTDGLRVGGLARMMWAGRE